MIVEITLAELLTDYDWAQVFADENAGNVSKQTDPCPPGRAIPSCLRWLRLYGLGLTSIQSLGGLQDVGRFVANWIELGSMQPIRIYERHLTMWTNDLPTKPGLYLWRRDENGVVMLVYLYGYNTYKFFNDSQPFPGASELGGQWCDFARVLEMVVKESQEHERAILDMGKAIEELKGDATTPAKPPSTRIRGAIGQSPQGAKSSDFPKFTDVLLALNTIAALRADTQAKVEQAVREIHDFALTPENAVEIILRIFESPARAAIDAAGKERK